MSSKDNLDEIKNKKVWTDAERSELAKKLDKELDDYIDNLDKKPYTEGWAEDKWEEEMTNHPFFMTEFPKDPNYVSPLLEGLQQLKYGEDDNTPEELAKNYKEDGNYHYKYKKYRFSILSYSKGIQTNCSDNELMCQLYNNRALAHLKLKNYRSSLNDCKEALKLKPNYIKVLYTATKCCFNIKDYDQCLEYCDLILKETPNDKEIVDLKSQAVKHKKLQLRDVRQQEIKNKKIDNTRIKILDVVKALNIQVDEETLFVDEQYHVYIDDDNWLVWPVVLFYPENNQSDFIQNFHENTVFNEQLVELFVEPPAWDTNKRYKSDSLNIYFEGKNKNTVHKINLKKTLREILQHEQFEIHDGTPIFFVFVANSKEEQKFLENYQ